MDRPTTFPLLEDLDALRDLSADEIVEKYKAQPNLLCTYIRDTLGEAYRLKPDRAILIKIADTGFSLLKRFGVSDALDPDLAASIIWPIMNYVPDEVFETHQDTLTNVTIASARKSPTGVNWWNAIKKMTPTLGGFIYLRYENTNRAMLALCEVARTQTEPSVKENLYERAIHLASHYCASEYDDKKKALILLKARHMLAEIEAATTPRFAARMAFDIARTCVKKPNFEDIYDASLRLMNTVVAGEEGWRFAYSPDGLRFDAPYQSYIGMAVSSGLQGFKKFRQSFYKLATETTAGLNGYAISGISYIIASVPGTDSDPKKVDLAKRDRFARSIYTEVKDYLTAHAKTDVFRASLMEGAYDNGYRHANFSGKRLIEDIYKKDPDLALEIFVPLIDAIADAFVENGDVAAAVTLCDQALVMWPQCEVLRAKAINLAEGIYQDPAARPVAMAILCTLAKQATRDEVPQLREWGLTIASQIAQAQTYTKNECYFLSAMLMMTYPFETKAVTPAYSDIHISFRALASGALQCVAAKKELGQEPRSYISPILAALAVTAPDGRARLRADDVTLCMAFFDAGAVRYTPEERRETYQETDPDKPRFLTDHVIVAYPHSDMFRASKGGVGLDAADGDGGRLEYQPDSLAKRFLMDVLAVAKGEAARHVPANDPFYQTYHRQTIS